MKTKSKTETTLKTMLAAAAVSALIPLATADDDIEVKVKDDDKVVIKTEDGDKVKFKGDDAKAQAQKFLSDKEAAEFKSQLVKGYVIPQERYTYLQPVPETYVATVPEAPEGMVYRYYDGVVYTVNPTTYTVVETTTVLR